jgi:molybdopterin molybdotransferase
VISVAEALEIVSREASPLDLEDVPLSRAGGRILASAVSADADFPPFDTTAMDGYAVRPGDDPGCARVRGETAAAGSRPPEALGPGEAVRVMTGAPVPEGTVGIVPVEQARRNGGVITWDAPLPPGLHVRRRGEVFRRGDPLIAAGVRLNPERIVLCAGAGRDPVPVLRRPRAIVLPTGNELVPAAAQPAAGQIRNGNGPGLIAALARRGVEAQERPPAADRREDIRRELEATNDFDLVLTTGGVSAGDFDETVEAASEADFSVLFHRVAVKPGMPVAFGRRRRTLWFGLPGNPVSALTTFELFAGAALARFEGRSVPTTVAARLLRPIVRKAAREGALDARLTLCDGRAEVEPLESHGSHDVRTSASRNALLFAPAGRSRIEEGEIVPCLPLPGWLD